MTKNNGGPAFPNNAPYGGMGMTLRDYFAANSEGLDAGTTDDFASVFNRDTRPPKDDGLAWAIWFAKADARLKYIKADAMIAARDAK